MKEGLPKNAVAYITLTTLLAAGGVVDAYFAQPLTPKQFLFVPLLIVLGMYSGSLKVPLFSNQKGNNSAHISLGFIITIISLLTYGPFLGIVTGISTMINPRRKHTESYKLLFNISAITITCWITNHLLTIFSVFGIKIKDLFISDLISDIPKSLLISTLIFASIFCHHVINSILLTGAISLAMKWEKQKALHFFAQSTLWVTPTYLIAGCFIIMCAWIISNLEGGFFRVVPLCVVVLPQPLLYLHNLRLHRERDAERERRFQELESLYSSMVQAMGRAIEAKDRYTQEHISRVVAMAMAIGRQLTLPEDKLRALEVGAALHDIGKIAIPDTVLNKPGKLTDEEFNLIKEHAALGSDILQPVPFPPEVVEAVRHHHEKWDGSGYPDKLKGEEIPLMARIVAVADVYDALTSDRPYRAAWSHTKAMEFMRSQSGTHFNTEIFLAFEKAMDTNPTLRSQAPESSPSQLRLAA